MRARPPRLQYRPRSLGDILKLAPFAFALPLLLAATNLVFAAVDNSDMVKQSVKKWGLQTEMPSETVTAPAENWLNFPVSTEFVRLMLWGCVMAGVVVVVWSLRDSLPVFSRSRKIIARDQAPPSMSPSNRMDEAQVEADDLARQGHYGEAMHVLLLKSLNEIRRQLGISFAVSLTSREILRRVQLPDIGHQSLTAIIASVERTYFGGRPAGQNDYSDCRSNFDDLKHSLATVAT
jgi:hypothetical protein